MNTHTLIEQEIAEIEGQLFGHGEEVVEISIYRKDGKILSIPYNKIKQSIRTFASRIVESVERDVIGEKEKLVPDINGLCSEVDVQIERALTRNYFREEMRTKLQMMKGK